MEIYYIILIVACIMDEMIMKSSSIGDKKNFCVKLYKHLNYHVYKPVLKYIYNKYYQDTCCIEVINECITSHNNNGSH